MPSRQITNQELRFGRVMPWVLIAVGLALALYAIAVRADRQIASVVEVHQPQESVRAGDAVRLARRTTTSEQMSDSLFGTLVAVAIGVVALGAFYSRVRNVTLGGNTISLGGPSEAQAIADVVTEGLAQGLRASGSSEVPVDSAIELAERAAQDSARLQQHVVQARVDAAVGDPTSQTDVLQRAWERSKLGLGASLPREVIEEIAADVRESSDQGRTTDS